ncbi:hypothetical protein ABEB36_008640 [Hypothenemus hampei]|uniref:Poly(A)-specific ribonuclease RNA-binding domain-containing protein n=1 Tax=Hypothenemus hampei TaxID=57062 RepID=A0ABD1EMK5_HYPHA
MEVTQSNFKDVLPDIEEGIKNCTFLSIDCELTGLKTVSNYVNAFDTPKQYYQKVIKDCREFLVIQYGITLFRFDESTDSFKHKSYNFYIFRKPMNKYIQDQRFLSQTTSIDFLINQGFDFNKLFKNGISYLNNCEEEKCRTFLEEQHRKRKESFSANTNRDIIPIPEENQEFVNEIKNQLERFLITDETEISLPKCNAFVRRLIYQTNSQFFADKISLETRQVERERILFAVKINSANPEDKNKVEQTKYDESVKKLEDFIGFSKVMRLIVESGKLIVGHNVLLDFLHTIDKFLTPLPDDYDEFKECASSLFSKVSDTKYMASSSPFKEFVSSTVLGDLMDRLGKTPFEIPQYELEDGAQGYSLKDSKQHEAGYDSFITGLSFLAMWKFLGSKKKLLNKEIFGSDGFNLLNSYLNRICLMILTDQQYLNLAGPDLNPSRDHVFYLSFPREWNTNNLAQLFSPFGKHYN